MKVKEIPITGWVVSSAACILSGILLYELIFGNDGTIGVLLTFACSFLVFYLCLLFFLILANLCIFDRYNEYLCRNYVKACVSDVKERIRDVKRKIDGVFKTTYKFK